MLINSQYQCSISRNTQRSISRNAARVFYIVFNRLLNAALLNPLGNIHVHIDFSFLSCAWFKDRMV